MRILPLLSLLVALAYGCSDQITQPEGSDAPAFQEHAGGGAAMTGLPLAATMQFGRNELGSPFPPPEGHDASTHAKDAMQPRTVVISRGGTVTFNVAPFHKPAIYEPGTQPEDIDTSLLEPSGAPFEFPPIINDPGGRITRGELALPGPDPVVPFAWTFTEPGRYLVICEVLPHFASNDMYGWVIVK